MHQSYSVWADLLDIAVAMQRPRPESQRPLVYGVVQDQDGQCHVIRHGRAPKPLDWRNPPPELVGQGDELNRAHILVIPGPQSGARNP